MKAPRRTVTEDTDYEVVVSRLTTDEVQEILKAYRAVAGKDFENLKKIATTLGEQVVKYQTAVPGALGLNGFTKWLQAQREQTNPRMNSPRLWTNCRLFLCDSRASA